MKKRKPIYKKDRTTYFYLGRQDIVYITVQYVWYYREIFVDIDFPEHCNSIVLCVMEGEIYSLYRKNQKDINQAVEDMLPVPVMKFVIKELLRMQSGALAHPVSPKLLHNPKTVYNSDLLYSCIEAPFKD